MELHDGLPDPAPAALDPLWTRRIRVLQATMTTVVVLAAVTELVTRMSGGAAGPGAFAALTLAVVGHAAAYRRRWAGLVLVTAAPVLDVLVGWDPIVAWNIVVFTTLVLTVRGLPALPSAIVAGGANLLAVGLAHGTIGLGDPTALVAAAAAAVGSATGAAVRNHAHYLAELHQRAEDAVAARRAAVDRGVVEERLRIARDLHDGVGHRIAVLSMRLGTAEVHLPADADQSRSDLTAARSDVQAVLAETQHILRILRVDDRPSAPGGPAPCALPPSHTAIPGIVDGFRAAGLEVDADLGDLSVPLESEASAALHRIVQEVLTNAHRHGTGSLRLRLDLASDPMTLDAVNLRSTGPAAPSTGLGLVGVAERVASVDGTLRSGPEGEEFRVRVELPVSRARR